MKIFESYKKMAKSMLIEHAWDRKFGEPLPTLEDTARKHEQDGDEEELAQIKWFGEKQGWGDNGELGKQESITINGKKYKEVKEEKKVTEKHILREMYEKIGGK